MTWKRKRSPQTSRPRHSTLCVDLDHDYLCHGVLEAERRANPSFTIAQEGYRSFRDAGSSTWRKWLSLLPPWQQILLVSQRVRGRFRYGPLRSYATWSLFRFAPFLLVFAIVAYAGIELLQRQQAAYDHRKAARLRASIGLYEEPSPTELHTLWDLAQSNEAVRDSFLVQALEHPATAHQFNRRADMAVQAVVGLDPNRRKQVLNNIVFPCLRLPLPDLDIGAACFEIGFALSLTAGELESSGLTVETLIGIIERTTDRNQLWRPVRALETVVGGLGGAKAQQVSALLITTIERTTDPGSFGHWQKA